MRYVIQNEREKGQAIVMVTLALIAMCGILGLAVDFGWAFFVKRAAQAAADSGALAAAQALRTAVGATGPYNCYLDTCRTNFPCTSSVVNDAADNLDNACLYAKQNGFIDAGRQRVRVDDGSSGSISGITTPPTRSGLEVQYWVTVRVTETVPQLFSAMMGNPWATVSARATAAILEAEAEGSLRLTNREGDSAWSQGNTPVIGENIHVQANNNGGAPVDAQGGILMASACDGTNCGSAYAGVLEGGSTVSAPFTHIRTTGSTSLSNNSTWSATPVNGKPDGGDFWDPTRGKTQPPIGSTPLTPCPVPGGILDGTNAPIVLGPGYYYATGRVGAEVTATGDKLRVRGNVTFSSGGSCFAGSSSTTAFGNDYYFFGGFDVQQQGQAGTNITFESARYVFAGVRNVNGANPAGTLFDVTAGTAVLNGTGANGLGAIFILTDGARYPGMAAHLNTLIGSNIQGAARLGSTVAYELDQGIARFRTGNSNAVQITLDGLKRENATGSVFPDELRPYNSVVIWQDRRNSNVMYDTSGNILNDTNYNVGCVGNTSTNCPMSSADKTYYGVTSNSPEMELQASPNVTVRGTVYQPRGAWLTLSAGSGANSALQIITGAVRVHAGANLTLLPTPNTIPQSLVALVE